MGGDDSKPAGKLRGIPESIQRLVSPQKDLLGHILGIPEILQQVKRQTVDHMLIAFHQILKRLNTACQGLLD
jgi:hypothetical protein